MATTYSLELTALHDSALKPATVPHVLSFDVEEYFHVESAARCARPETWPQWPKRLAASVDLILQQLADANVIATFFVLGWVAVHEPDIVRRLAKAGHEIASHGMTHRRLHLMTPVEFRRELLDSRQLLEDLTGRAVLGYRAPTFSLTHATAWALPVLAESGYRYDSSIFPIHHDRYGVPEAPPDAHLAIGPAGAAMLELPPLTVRAAGLNWPVGGGGYFRLLPGWLVRSALRHATAGGRCAMLYLHPWELDPAQPEMPLSFLRRWRHRVNLAGTSPKLQALLKNFAFGPASAHVHALSARELPRFQYGV